MLIQENSSLYQIPEEMSFSFSLHLKISTISDLYVDCSGHVTWEFVGGFNMQKFIHIQVSQQVNNTDYIINMPSSEITCIH